MADLKIFMVHEDFIDLCTFMIEKFQAEFFPETVFGNSIISGLKTIEEIKFHLYNFPPDYSLSFFITMVSCFLARPIIGILLLVLRELALET